LRRALFLLTVLTISRVHQHFPVVALLRPALLLAGLALVYAILNPRLLAGWKWTGRWPAKVVVGLGVVACLSAPFGISFGYSAKTILEDYAKVLIFCFMLMAVLRHTGDVSMFIWAYVLSCGILAWMSLTVFGLAATHSGLERLGGLYTYDANDVGCVLMIGLPLTLLVLQTSRLRGKLLAVLILLGIGVTIARTGSRGAFVGLLVVGALLLLTLPGVTVSRRLGFVAITVVALVTAAPPGYWKQMQTLTSPEEDYNWQSPTGRRQLAIRGLHYWMEYPVFGIGIGNFGRAEGQLSERAKTFEPGMPGIKWSAPHNSFLEVGVELGPLGLALWSSLVLGGIIGMRRLRRRLPATWAIGDREQRFIYLTTVYFPVALAGFAVTSFFVSFAYMDPIYVVAALLTGVYGCAEARLRQDGIGAVAARTAVSARRERLSGYWGVRSARPS